MLLILALLSAPSSEASAAETPTASIGRIEEAEAPRIDGALLEEVWDRAVPITDLRQVEPVAGAPPSERTEILLLHDERTIYVGLRCFDSDPSGIRDTQSARDANLDPDDRVELLFDPFLDRRNGFWFQIGPAGSRGDALISRGSTFDKQWNTIWYGRARITEEGWEAEVAIPVVSINFDPDARAWGFNARRFVRRKNEELRWASPDPRLHFFSPAEAGTLTGVGPLQQGLGLDLKPFAVGDLSRPEGGDTDTELDAGLDVFWRLTPSSKLSLSFNTDFAETESDDRIVNLTRFPLFFPEKRDFFLEDSGNFVFGAESLRRELIPFFSRRIGLDSEGREVGLRVAGKLTGREGPWSYGLLGVQTDDEADLDSQELLVARVSHDLLEQSDVGVLWTHGDPRGGTGSDTYGVDLNLRTSEFLGDRSLRLSTLLLASSSDDVVTGDPALDRQFEDELAYHASLDYPNDELDLGLSYTVVEDDFDPALGFVRRSGIKEYEAEAGFRPRPGGVIRQYDFRVRPLLVTSSDNRTETVDILLRPLGIDFESGDELRIDVLHRREVLDEDFQITDDVLIPRAAYTFTRYGIVLESSDKRPVDAQLSAFNGDFFDGERTDLALEVGLRAWPRLLLQLDYELNDVRLPGGDFQVHVGRLDADLQLGPDLTWSNFAQWDNQSDQLGLNSRLWWIPRSGTEVFLVLNQGWEVDRETFAPEDSQLTLKVGTTFRF